MADPDDTQNIEITDDLKLANRRSLLERMDELEETHREQGDLLHNVLREMRQLQEQLRMIKEKKNMTPGGPSFP